MVHLKEGYPAAHASFSANRRQDILVCSIDHFDESEPPSSPFLLTLEEFLVASHLEGTLHQDHGNVSQ